MHRLSQNHRCGGTGGGGWGLKYYRPSTLTEYFRLMADLPAEKVVRLAGGTDLLPAFGRDRTLPLHLVDLKGLPDLTGVHDGEGQITIGALATLAELESHPLARQHCPALAAAAREFAGVQIRHRATLGGNIVNASPAGDSLPPLYAHDARVRIATSDGQRELPLAELVTGPGETALAPGELLTGVVIPKRPGLSIFYKLGLRNSMAIAVVNFALTAVVEGGGFSQLAVAAGAVAPTVVPLRQFTEALVAGAALTEALPLVDEDIAPITDLRATADYRRRVLKNLLEHTLASVLNGEAND